jgi:hypothetical protein
MSLLTQISNKLQYSVSQWASDPEAEAYAKDKAKQDEQNAETKKRIDEAKKKSDDAATAKAETEAEAKSVADRSEFKPQRATGNVAAGIVKGFMSLILTLLILYGGHLAANEAIGYKIPFRILSFVYGCLFFFIEIPKMLIRRYWYEIKPAYYTYLPISTYEPMGDLEILFLGAFCYKEDNASQMARATVETLYKTAFEKSQIKTE